MALAQKLRLDSKGRVTLGMLAKGATAFYVSVDKDHRIILEPLVEIPAREKWLFENKAALNQVKKGIHDAAKGKVKKHDFSKYLNEEKE